MLTTLDFSLYFSKARHYKAPLLNPSIFLLITIHPHQFYEFCRENDRLQMGPEIETDYIVEGSYVALQLLLLLLTPATK